MRVEGRHAVKEPANKGEVKHREELHFSAMDAVNQACKQGRHDNVLMQQDSITTGNIYYSEIKRKGNRTKCMNCSHIFLYWRTSKRKQLWVWRGAATKLTGRMETIRLGEAFYFSFLFPFSASVLLSLVSLLGYFPSWCLRLVGPCFTIWGLYICLPFCCLSPPRPVTWSHPY